MSNPINFLIVVVCYIPKKISKKYMWKDFGMLLSLLQLIGKEGHITNFKTLTNLIEKEKKKKQYEITLNN